MSSMSSMSNSGGSQFDTSQSRSQTSQSSQDEPAIRKRPEAAARYKGKYSKSGGARTHRYLDKANDIIRRVHEENDALAHLKYPSRGSKNHGKGQCRPCKLVFTPEGCARGAMCNFCHAFHEDVPQDGTYQDNSQYSQSSDSLFLADISKGSMASVSTASESQVLPQYHLGNELPSDFLQGPPGLDPPRRQLPMAGPDPYDSYMFAAAGWQGAAQQTPYPDYVQAGDVMPRQERPKPAPIQLRPGELISL
eukprot:TRINITY_DN17763_c0_g1_i2.p1 TRINITY_DN17763_c0_g1~~TRINITY_DN17763_c0_g1_i2.p1  ORF type:complete len:250 (-),score=18.53 TRINITY_DN17763_c0_g1_i2:127-876(-)